MSNTVIPAGYKSLLGLYDTQKAIGLIKTIFQEKNLRRAAPQAGDGPALCRAGQRPQR